MNPSKTLVVYYSRTGATRRAAQQVAKELGAPLSELQDTKRRDGLVGYFRCALEGTLGRLANLTNPYDEARDCDLVVVGTPVWNASLSSPVRAFLRHHHGRLQRVAFFVTEGGRGSERVFSQMAAEAGQEPVARLVLRVADFQKDSAAGQIEAFARSLRPAPSLRVPPPPPDGARVQP